MRLLIVEDEKGLAQILKKGLEENSFTVDISFDGEDGLYNAETNAYDAIVLDVMLPKIDGFTVLKNLREQKISTPVLMLTAKGGVENKIMGLNGGADDYLVKPFDFVELLARINAIIRRNKGSATPIAEVEDLTLNTNSKEVKRGGIAIKLSIKEYNILEYLVLNKNRVISRTELTEHIYDMDFDKDSNVIDVYINYLRNKIDKDFDHKLIQTVRGAGYILKETVS